tara:strand:- start:2335 stop:2646 length:312 start_codon:yes stop_codon:yes gene_type:complete
MAEKKLYKPLPDYLSIGPSDIHGAGIIANEDIPAGIEIGITHIYDPDFEDDYIRTPLGGFINHADDPNCEINENESKEWRILYTKNRIESGTELTITYTLYKL